MPGFDIYNVKDIDGRWWSFARQNEDMSCGPTSVKIAKELYHNKKIGEKVIRGLVGLEHLHTSHTGMSLLASARATQAVWEFEGTLERYVLPAVKSEPLPIPHARFVHGIHHLQSSSRNHPAILGFNWTSGGGHFVVCVGPTRIDPSLLVILDPDSGLEYLSTDESVMASFYYKPSYGAIGEIDPRGYIIT